MPSCKTFQCPFPSGICFLWLERLLINNPLLGKDSYSRDFAMNACKMNRSLCCITSTARKQHGHAPVRPWALWGRWRPLLCSVQERFKGLSVLSTQLDNGKEFAACIAGQIQLYLAKMNRFLNASKDPSIKMKNTKERCPQSLTNNQSIFHKDGQNNVM